MLTVSMIQPHDPYLCRQDKWDRYAQDEIDLPQVRLGHAEEDPHSARLRYIYGASDIDLDAVTIRNARRAYYSAISDIDDKVSELLAALAESGVADNTIVILTADHGDMLGERGMWFKMTFLEYSARVPLIVHAPIMFSAHRIRQAVSLVDLLPTLIELARDGKPGDYATPLEGRSLVPHLSNGSGHDEAIGEYFAEGTDAPMFMIRRGSRKLIHAEGDPAQYFDLADDPLEVHNLADNPTHAPQVDVLLKEIRARYDSASLKETVLESQRRRNVLKHVMRDQGVSWDYQPDQDAARTYVRNNMPIYELEKRSRFPHV